jgi:oligopeptide/dipeptide ABC transporter ATP-binding protein
MTPLLEVRGLHVKFATGLWHSGRAVHALAGIDLAVQPGETLGLVGESGCGKTTLARCILRLQEPTEGTVLFDGCDLSRLAPGELRVRRREFQMIFQDPFTSLDPRMTISEILAEPFEVHGLLDAAGRTERARELLNEVALEPGLLARRPSELSGGQQQRVAIARSLALKPRLLVADEPVSALDVSVQAQILNLLAELRQRHGLTLILISHSLPVVCYLCSRVAVMYLGCIVEEAATDEFFTTPQHPYSQALIDSVPGLELNGENPGKPALGGDVPSPAARPSGCPFHPRCPKVFARCREEVPPLASHRPGSKVACFLYS